LDFRDNGFPSKQEEVARVGNLQKVLMIHDINLMRGHCNNLPSKTLNSKSAENLQA
jgi:hypothetical protein